MSIRWMTQVWDHTELEGSELLLMLALADHANDDGICWPSIPRLAQRARISERQTQRLIRKLTKAGYIKVMERGNGRGHKTYYVLILPASGHVEKGDIWVSPFLDAKKGDIAMSPIEGVKGDIVVSPIPEKRVTNETQRVTSSALKGDIAMSPDPIEPSIEPSGGSAPNGAAPHSLTNPSLCSEPALSARAEGAARRGVEKGQGWQEFLDALCWVCYGHRNVEVLPDRQRGQLVAEARRIHESGRSTDDLRTWFSKVWKLDWQWKKDKARPGPAHVRASIASIDAQAPAGFDDKDNPAAIRPNGAAPPMAPVPSVEKTALLLERRCNVTDRRPLSNEELKALKERQERDRQEALYQRQQQQLQQGRSM